MNWSEERAKLLKQLWAEGWPASQIAEKLGDVSRNAVIGKAHRMALEPRGKSASAARIHGEKPEPKRRRHVRMVKIGAIFVPRVALAPALEQRRAAAAAIAPPPSVVMDPETQSARCSIMEINDDRCRWIMGDERKPLDAVFCGAKASRNRPWGPFKTPSCPYCDWHAEMAVAGKKAA